MYSKSEKQGESRNRNAADHSTGSVASEETDLVFVNNRLEASMQQSLQMVVDSSVRAQGHRNGTAQVLTQTQPAIQLMPTGKPGGNPKGRGGGKHDVLKQQSLRKKPSPKVGSSKPRKYRKKKQKSPAILRELLRIGHESLGFDNGLTLTQKKKIAALINAASWLLAEPKRAHLLAYLEAIKNQISMDDMVKKVILKIKQRSGDADGHFNPVDNEVVLNTGEIESNPFKKQTSVEDSDSDSDSESEEEELNLISPEEFLALVVHEFTHVMDFSARKMDEEEEDDPTYVNYVSGDGDLSHEESAGYLRAMIGNDKIAAQYNRKSPGVTYSEILARFAEAGVGGKASAEMKRGFMEYRRTEFLKVLDLQKPETLLLAIAYGNGMTRKLLMDIFNKVILPFVRASEDGAVGHYFLQILFDIGSGEDIANEGEIEWGNNLVDAVNDMIASTENVMKMMGGLIYQSTGDDRAMSQILTPRKKPLKFEFESNSQEQSDE